MRDKAPLSTLLAKEYQRLMFSPIVLTTVAIFLVALALATVHSVNTYKWNLHQYNSIAESSSESITAFLGVNAIAPPQPNHVLARGVSDILSRPISIMRQIRASFNMKYSVGLERRQKDLIYSLIPEVDPLMVMRYLLAVLALIFTFDQICGERQQGTLQQSLSNPVWRRQILSAKIISGLIAMLAVITLAALVVLSVIWAMDVSMPHEDLWRTALIFLAAYLYGAAFLAIGTLISASVRTAGVSILVCLAVWCILVIVAPGITTQLAEVISPAPPANQIYMDKLSLEREIGGGSEVLQQGDRTLEQWFADLEEFNKEKLTGIRNKDRDFHNKVRQQELVAQMAGLVSPAVNFESVATTFAGTGIDEEHEMLDQLYRYFGAVAEKDDFEWELLNRARDNKPDPEKDKLPVFKYEPLPPQHLLRSTATQWAALIITTLVLFGIAYWRFNSYDVRAAG